MRSTEFPRNSAPCINTQPLLTILFLCFFLFIFYQHLNVVIAFLAKICCTKCIFLSLFLSLSLSVNVCAKISGIGIPDYVGECIHFLFIKCILFHGNGSILINKCLEEMHSASRTCRFIITVEVSLFNLVLEEI